MKTAWQIASLGFLAFAIFVLARSFDYPYMDRLGPGPGFFPFWLSLITGGLALGLLVQVSLSKSLIDAEATLLPDRSGGGRILFILAALIGVLILLPTLGFRICMFLFLVLLPPALGVRSWWVLLIFALGGSFGVFHIFYYRLKLPLPIGVFGI
jgi:putative tricarboxylic transport membrane protein